jgi:toxin FitB
LTRVIILDAGPLSELVHQRERPGITKWLRMQLALGVDVKIPDICDYEVRRELIHKDFQKSINNLDYLRSFISPMILTSEIMFAAAGLWADMRKKGLSTSPPEALDGDVILAALARSVEVQFDEVIIATTNVRHLIRFATQKMTAKRWEDIT